jgi:hypothetical protein
MAFFSSKITRVPTVAHSHIEGRQMKLLITLLALLPLTAFGATFKCINEGTVTFSDRPCKVHLEAMNTQRKAEEAQMLAERNRAEELKRIAASAARQKKAARAAAYEIENETLVQNFCYALQAAGECEELQMRVDTERVIERRVGSKLRGVNSVYNEDCWAGLTRAFKEVDEGNDICSRAWREFGCHGKKEPRLIQQNSRLRPNGVFCRY